LHFHHIKNAEDVDIFWKMFSNYPSGGGTDISRIVTSIANEEAHENAIKTPTTFCERCKYNA
jgi:hypothetical protein